MVLGIYGAGGLGREILLVSRQINLTGKRWDKIIFIDDAEINTSESKIDNITYRNMTSQYSKQSIEIAIAVGEPGTRRKLREKISKDGYPLALLVHPSVYIPEDTRLGAGTIVSYNCFLSCGVTVEENVLLQPGIIIGHDNVIGSDSVISTNVVIAGGCRIGSETYIGLQVPVKENITIGSRTIVGMGSVVERDIPDEVIALGNPARPMKRNIDQKVFH